MIFGDVTQRIQEIASKVFPSYATDQVTSSVNGDYVSFKQSSVPRGSQVFVSTDGGNTGPVYLVEDENGDETTGAKIPAGGTRGYAWSDLSVGTFYVPNSDDTIYAETEAE